MAAEPFVFVPQGGHSVFGELFRNGKFSLRTRFLSYQNFVKHCNFVDFCFKFNQKMAKRIICVNTFNVQLIGLFSAVSISVILR